MQRQSKRFLVFLPAIDIGLCGNYRRRFLYQVPVISGFLCAPSCFRECRGSTREERGRIIDVVERSHARSKINVGERLLPLFSIADSFSRGVFVFVRAD